MNKIKVILATVGILSFALAPVMGFAQVVMAADPATSLECGTRNGKWDDTTKCTDFDAAPTTTPNDLVKTIINLLSWVVGVISVIMIIIAGFKYVTSGGNDSSVSSAKKTILYAIVGLVIVALAQVIVRFVLSNVA